MHIGIVAWEFPPEIGGMQTYAHEFVRELVKRGFEVTVFTRPHDQGEVELRGATIVPSLTGIRNRDRAALAAASVDAWHVMNAGYAWLALETGPVVVSVHGNDFLDPYVLTEQAALGRFPLLWRWSAQLSPLETALGKWRTRRMLRRALPRAHHVLANSRYTEEVFLQQFPKCKGRTSAGMVGVGERFFAPQPARVRAGKTRLITVTRLSERRKNVDVVIRALALLKDSHPFSYTVVGDGFLRPELEALAGSLGLADRIAFAGFLPAEEVPRRLAESDLFVLASSINPGSHEGFGIAYLEANACGTPVLAARLAGAVEAVREHETGLFVAHPDVSSVAEALDRFMSGRVRFDAEACRRFARGFTWSGVVDHAVGWYDGTAGTPQARIALNG